MANTIIITGGAGFVGHHLAQELEREHGAGSIVIWDMNVANAPTGFPAHVVDMTQPDTYRSLLASTQPAWIVHLAGLSAVGQSFVDPNRTSIVHNDATRLLLETITEHSPATKMLAVSSADIYGQRAAQDTVPLPELPLADALPVNPYAESKLAMEKMIEATFNDRVVRVRPFPHIGPGQRQGFVVADFASQIAAIEAGQQPPEIKVGNLDAVRDFTDVRDVVRAYRLLLQPDMLGAVYHVCSGTGHKINTVLEELLSLSPVSITVTPDPARLRPADVPYLVGSAAKLQAATNWEPEIPFSQTLRDVLDHWRSYFKKT